MSSQNPFPAAIDSEGYQTLCASCSESDRLRLVSGNLVKSVNLVTVPTVGPPLSLYLTYNAQGTIGSNALGREKWLHNYMVSLAKTGSPPTLITFTSDTGRQFEFAKTAAGPWVLNSVANNGGSYFADMELLAEGADESTCTWKLTFFPSKTFFRFDASGVLTRIEDRHGNALTFAYSSGKLTSITEPTGRSITLEYSSTAPYDGSYLTSVTDPNNNVISLAYNTTTRNLEQISLTGCVISYTYGSNYLITGRTFPEGGSYEYAYDSLNRLIQVKDSENPQNTLSYSYVPDDETDREYIGYGYWEGGTMEELGFFQTRLTDARGKVWTFRFDQSGSLWRIMDPLDHWVHTYSDDNQQGAFYTDAYPLRSGSDQQWPAPRVNPNNRMLRNISDAYGNVLYSIGPTGLVSQFTYNSDRLSTSAYQGQGHQGIQGYFADEFGKDGYFLCAWEGSSTDAWKLPGYISTVSPTAGAPDGERVLETEPAMALDPRSVSAVPGSTGGTAPGGLQRKVGRWQPINLNTDFQLVVTADGSSREFNLSIYTNSADMGLSMLDPMESFGAFGRDLELSVQDMNGTQTFRVYNNAPGVWVTFPVKVDATHTTVTVTVRAMGETARRGKKPTISAIAFDPPASRKTTMAYNASGDMTSVTDRLGKVTAMAYNADGTLQSVTDALNNTTSFYYEDAYKNLTRVVDAAGGVTTASYDANGNLLKVVDPENRETLMTYDARNRVTMVTDAMGNQTQLSYSANGNLHVIEDAEQRQTTLNYTRTNRLKEIVDPVNGASKPTKFEYDAGGLLLKVTDPRNQVTQFVRDDAGQVVDILYPNSQKTNLGRDAWGRVVAVNPPNATQSDPDTINRTGALNLVKNPDFSELDPYDNTYPRFWSKNKNYATYGSTEGRNSSYGVSSKTYSTDICGWSQKDLDLPAGVQSLARADTTKGSDGSTVKAQLKLAVNDVGGNPVTIADDAAAATLPTSPSDWTTLPWLNFKVPSDSQYLRFSTELRPTGKLLTGGGSPVVRWDNMELYMLGVAYQYNHNDQLREVRTPDGAVTQLKRDRFGRVTSWVDPQGRITALSYDTMDRVKTITDPLGNTVSFSYNDVGALTSFTDARNKVTSYIYDVLNRLTTITYPDSSTEQFTYLKNGLLATYTDNMSRTRTFAYDRANRLVRVTYSDGKQVYFHLDKVGNVTHRRESNGDATFYQRDALDRVVSVRRIKASGNSTPEWSHVNTFDENGNRTALKAEVPGGASVYGTATYYTPPNGPGTQWPYVALDPFWSIPSGGLDSLDRMTKFQDRNGLETQFAFDVDGRRTQITCPKPTVNPVHTDATYDLMGRLLKLETKQSTNTLLTLEYGYDLASQRVGMVATQGSNSDTFDYGLDASGRLVEMALNRFVERRKEHFREGSLSNAQITTDTNGDKVALAPVADSFSGTSFESDRWVMRYSNPYPSSSKVTPYVGLEARQKDGLHLAFPRGYHDVGYSAGMFPVLDPYGRKSALIWAGAEHRQKLSGDFDIQVDFADLQMETDDGEPTMVGLRVAANALPADAEDKASGGIRAMIFREKYAGVDRYHARTWQTSTLVDATSSTASDTSGKFRIARTSNSLQMYYWTGSAWQALGSALANFTGDLYLSLFFSTFNSVDSVRFKNFQRVSGASLPRDYPATGTYESAVYDAGRTVTWDKISWTENLPSNCNVEFQVALSSSPSGPWTYQGPLGSTSNKFTTPSGESILDASSQPRTGRYARYKAFLTANTTGTPGSSTPDFTKVQLTHNGANTSALHIFDFDAAGNMTKKTVETASTTTVEDRNTAGHLINDLNQVLRNAISVNGGAATNWDYTYNSNGCVTQKTDGTNTWTFTWSEDNRLTRVQGPGGVDVQYQYDAMGRMLTRASGGVTTKFTWDGWTCIKEDDGTTVTRYFAPQGELHSFERGSTLYQVHADGHNASVRALTDSTGAVVASYSYAAWGEILSASEPSGFVFPYKFCGSLGVRHDNVTGLYYMRNRWYDAGLGRFVSRDVLGGVNRYAYAANTPTTFVDQNGLEPQWPYGWGKPGDRIGSPPEAVLPGNVRPSGIFQTPPVGGPGNGEWSLLEGVTQWGKVIYDYLKWKLGDTNAFKEYGPGSMEVRQMKDSRLVEQARRAYAEGTLCPNQAMAFNWMDSLQGFILDNNATRSFTGSFHITITPFSQTEVRVTISNSTTSESAFRHREYLGFSRTTQELGFGRPESNVYEDMVWEEASPTIQHVEPPGNVDWPKGSRPGKFY